jgi:hypothetical protein
MKQIHHRLISRWMLTALLLCLTACASIPAPAPKKVQTYEELFLKLKEGFYSGRLMEEEFYAKELGYPLKAPLRFLPDNYPDLDREQRLVFEEVGITGDWLIVVNRLNEQGQKAVFVRFQKHFSSCLSDFDIKKIWGEGNLQLEKRESASHPNLRPGQVYVTPIQLRSNHKTKTQNMSAGFEFSGTTKCLGQAGFSITDTKE